jgi:transposase InsO family protein
MTVGSAVATLRNAVALRDPQGTTLHSDRGSQFRSRKFVELLRETDITASMGRVGVCADNAAMESFFSLLQKNVLNRKRWHSRQELRLEIVTWIERTYHRRRRQQRLGRLTPVESEIINSQTTYTA